MGYTKLRFALLCAAQAWFACSAEHGSSDAARSRAQATSPAGASAQPSAADTAQAGSHSDAPRVGAAPAPSAREDALAVDLVPLRCSASCLEVRAVAKGGNPPYHYLWQDGSADATRSLCPADGADWSVVVTDTALTNSEFAHAMLTTRAILPPELLHCGQQMACTSGAVASIASGHYQGTVGGCTAGEQIELPDDHQQPALGQVTLDLQIDPMRTEQSGQLQGSWVVGGLITFKATVTAVLDCNTGVLHGTWSGQWGYALGDPSTQIDSGPSWGDLTLAPVANMQERLSGSFNMFSALPAGTTGVDLSTIPGLPASAGAPGAPAPDAGPAPGLTMGGRCTHGTIRIERTP